MSHFTFPVLLPLIRRHAEDAAFYWSQLDRSLESTAIDVRRAAHFNGLLQAHLDGLAIAGQAAWNDTFRNLKRWNKPGEAFVCTWLAVQLGEAGALDDVMDVVGQRPDELLRGVVSALAWDLSNSATQTIAHWLRPEAAPVRQTAAIRAAALIGGAEPGVLAIHFQSDVQFVRAAACRAAARQADAEPFLAQLLQASDDAALAVRAEAAIGLARTSQHSRASSTLLRCVRAQVEIHAAASGWNRKQSGRRLNRWLAELALLPGLQPDDIAQITGSLGAREVLTFLLWHGDAAYLPWVVAHMDTERVARYAGWVWQTLTGIVLDQNGLTLPEPAFVAFDEEPLSEQILDGDRGLPLPDRAAVLSFQAAQRPPSEGPILLGARLQPAHTLELLDHAPQAIRAIAAQRINRMHYPVRVDVRAPVCRQLAAMAVLRGYLPGTGAT